MIEAIAAVESLETRFAHERAAIDSDARALRDANRLDSTYASRYAAFEMRRRSAVALRDARDRARRTRDAMVARAATPRE